MGTAMGIAAIVFWVYAWPLLRLGWPLVAARDWFGALDWGCRVLLGWVLWTGAGMAWAALVLPGGA